MRWSAFTGADDGESCPVLRFVGAHLIFQASAPLRRQEFSTCKALAHPTSPVRLLRINCCYFKRKQEKLLGFYRGPHTSLVWRFPRSQLNLSGLLVLKCCFLLCPTLEAANAPEKNQYQYGCCDSDQCSKWIPDDGTFSFIHGRSMAHGYDRKASVSGRQWARH